MDTVQSGKGMAGRWYLTHVGEQCLFACSVLCPGCSSGGMSPVHELLVREKESTDQLWWVLWPCSWQPCGCLELAQGHWYTTHMVCFCVLVLETSGYSVQRLADQLLCCLSCSLTMPAAAFVQSCHACVLVQELLAQHPLYREQLTSFAAFGGDFHDLSRLCDMGASLTTAKDTDLQNVLEMLSVPDR